MTWSDSRTPSSGPRPIEPSAGRAGGSAPSPRRGAPSSSLRRWPRRRRRRGPRGAPAAPPAHYPRPRRHDLQRPRAGERRRCRVRRQTTALSPVLSLVVPQRLLGAKAPRRRTASPPTLPLVACRSSTTRRRAPPARHPSPRRAVAHAAQPRQRRRRPPSDCRRPCRHCTRTRVRYSTRPPVACRCSTLMGNDVSAPTHHLFTHPLTPPFFPRAVVRP